MNALEKNIAVARGEALAANLLASAAIQALFAMLPIANRKQALAGISAFIDGTLNSRTCQIYRVFGRGYLSRWT